jgi:hypothetical protein
MTRDGLARVRPRRFLVAGPAMAVLIASIAVAALACSSAPRATPIANTAAPSPGVPRELCAVLARVIDEAPRELVALRGEPIEFPLDVSPGAAQGAWRSTLTIEGGTATILLYGWIEWRLEFPGATFDQAELERSVLACPAVAGWPRDEVSEVLGVVRDRTTVFLEANEGAPALQVHQEIFYSRP